MTLFGLADVNNFYVSCERVFQPRLSQQATIVLSNSNGCIVARSNEAKQLGIPMGAPVYQYQDIIRQHRIHVFSSNFTLYGDMSHRFMTLLEALTEDVHTYSIDEAFLTFNKIPLPHLDKHAQNIVKDVRQGLGLPICIGLASTKTLAKIANHYAKKHQIVHGVLRLTSAHQLEHYLHDLPVEDIWGIGKRTAQQLHSMGLRTALALRDADIACMRKRFSIHLERTIRELRGQACIELKQLSETKQHIICSRSFGKKITEKHLIREALAYHITRGCLKLREQNSLARCLTIQIRTNRFNANEKQYAPSVTLQLPTASDNTSEFLSLASQGLNQIYLPAYQYKKAGIILSDLTHKQYQQSDLLHTSSFHQNLMPVLDQINRRMGKGTLKFATENFHPTWSIRKNQRSQNYTTCWKELIRVN